MEIHNAIIDSYYAMTDSPFLFSAVYTEVIFKAKFRILLLDHDSFVYIYHILL